MSSTETPATTDLAALKNRQQAAWSCGDYAVIGTTLQLVGEMLAEACDLNGTNAFSTWQPATAMPHSPPLAAAAK